MNGSDFVTKRSVNRFGTMSRLSGFSATAKLGQTDRHAYIQTDRQTDRSTTGWTKR